jgi:hypothetical protein
VLVKKLKKRQYHKKWVTSFFAANLLLFPSFLFAQQPEIQTSVSKNNILIGEQFDYNVSVSMPDNTYRLTWFNTPDSLGNFRLVRQNKIDSTYANGNWNFTQHLTLTSFDSGKQVIPSLTLNFGSLQSDSSFNVLTDTIPVQVNFAPMDSVKTFHDIKSIIEVEKRWPWWWWALAVVALVLLVFWIRFLVKFFKKKKGESALFDSKLKPYDEAMQLLSKLEAEHLTEKSEEKQFHFRLNEIFKRYISRETKTFKMHLTSDEILVELKEFNIQKDHVFEFANSLKTSDAVKFARFIPSGTENEKCLQATKNMIIEINDNLNKKPGSAV